jgi:hypothetical protein
VQKHGTIMPFKLHCRPCGCRFPGPVFLSISVSSPSQEAKGYKPWTIIGSYSFTENIKAHISGSPVAVVKPKTVKCASFIFAFCCGHSPTTHITSHPLHFHHLPDLCFQNSSTRAASRDRGGNTRSSTQMLLLQLQQCNLFC